MNGGVIGKENRPTVSSAVGVWGLNEAYHARLGNNWPREMLVDVGSFTKQDGVGSQVINLNSGATWTPKAIIFYAGGSDLASATWSPGILHTIGFAAGNGDYALGNFSNDDEATSETSRRMAAKAVTTPNAAGNNVLWEADVSAFNAGSFTLNWTSNAADSRVICYVALGGDIEAEVLNWQTPTAVGDKVVSTGTFQPDLVFHLGNINTVVTGSTVPFSFGFGAMNSAGEQWAVSTYSGDAVVSSAATSSWGRTDAAFVIPSDMTEFMRFNYVSMNSNGFTVNFPITAASAREMASLSLKGVKSKLGSFNKTGAVAPATQSITDPGFKPAGVITAHLCGLPTTPGAHAPFVLGASDGSHERSIAFMDVDAVTPTRADSIWVSGKGALGIDSNSATLQAQGDVAPTTQGFDVTWTTNDTSTETILYAAIT